MAQTKAQLISGASSQSVTFNDATVSSINGGPIGGARNRIINGDMRIDQRNAGASVSLGAGGTYIVDRFYNQASQASKVSAQRSTTAPSDFTNSLLSTVLSAVTPGAADYFTTARQNIEGLNVADLNWGTAAAKSVTISFWVRSSVIGTYSYFVNNSAGNRGYIATFSISAANTWEYKSLTIPGDTSGTWLSDNGIGIAGGVDLGSGSNFNGTANTWSGSAGLRTSGSVNWISNAGATFYITGVQLEQGSTATPFERRSYGQELALCQRYYEAKGAVNFSMWPPVSNNAGNIAARRSWVPYVVEKRTSPTVTVSKSQALTSESTLSYTNGFSYNGDQGSFLETVITAWTASAEL